MTVATADTELGRVSFVDVGHGDAAVLQDNEGATIVVDCPNVGVAQTAEIIRERGSDNVDAIIVSHRDLDHCGGVAQLLRTVKVKDLYLNAGWVVAPDGSRDSRVRAVLMSILDAVEETECAMHPIVAPTHLATGGIEIDVLAPDHSLVVRATMKRGLTNESSVVLKAEIADTKVLLTGDMEEPAARKLLASTADLSAEIFHVPHHGGGLAVLPAVLDAVGPTFSVISNGSTRRQNPSSSTLTTLAADGQRFMCTEVGRHCQPGIYAATPCAGTVRVRIHAASFDIEPDEPTHSAVVASWATPQCAHRG